MASDKDGPKKTKDREPSPEASIPTIDEEAKKPMLTVKTLSDRKLSIPLTPELTIGEVRRQIADKEGAEASASPLVSRGIVLDVASTTVESLQLPDEARCLHLFWYEPAALLADPIESASDWDAKNRLRMFRGAWALANRDFALGAELLSDALATFAEPSFVPFRTVVRWAVIAGTLTFDRPSLLKRIIRSPEVLEVIQELGPCDQLVSSLYACRYAEFFRALVDLESALLKDDWLLAKHVPFLVKELRIRAYAQQIAPYRTLSLAAMAQSFGVSVEFIDGELSRFIAAGRLHCSIDRVAGVVEAAPEDPKQAQFNELIKEGDTLFHKAQRLSRLVSY